MLCQEHLADGTRYCTGYEPTAGGPIVGVIPVAEFTATTITLAPGDTLFLYGWAQR